MDKKERNKMILILGIMAFFANGDNYAVSPLLGSIATDLNISLSQAAMSVTAYMLTFGVFTIIIGPLGDKYGKTRVINIASFGTAIFSMLGAFAFSLPSLIFLRAMNGAFGAGIFPVTMALVGENSDDSNRQKSLGKVMGMMFLGGASATAIGGTMAYLGSWRLVYFIYGLAELIIALVMFKVLPKSEGSADKIQFIYTYKEALKNKGLLMIVGTIFLVGFSVFGSFTYTGQLVEGRTGYNVLIVGLILTLFGLATVIGGRMAPSIKAKLKSKFLLVAGLVGAISLFTIAKSFNIAFISIGLIGFGLAFIAMQSTLVNTAQERLPKYRGTAMSLASFCMFVGGAVGTNLNGMLLQNREIEIIFIISSIAMVIVAIISTKIIDNR
ncbi:MFS transporter [Clostridium senegalense]|uniref:MFS transporter n=1 Tax=Clostridium senegalense TaxID=1465809 RepID=UPI001C111EF6|nr:MFS transporter [Clostridium senegalense]MBU5226253.1 MFS transporter [Clostridium senegalense]